MLKKIFLILVFVLFKLSISAQEPIPVLTLGTFHFDFPNLDRVQYSDENQIDVLDIKYQNEIKRLVQLLARFKPTVIAIERSPENQVRIDSLYQKYLNGK